MSADGAHLGVSAKRALDTILGGEPSPTREEGMDPVAFREWLLLSDQEPLDYEEAARRAGREILRFLLADPKRASIPAETVYDWTGFDGEGIPPVIEKGLYEAMKEAGAMPEDGYGLSGFQWGWAVNAARRSVELPPVPNRALLTVEVPTEADR